MSYRFTLPTLPTFSSAPSTSIWSSQFGTVSSLNPYSGISHTSLSELQKYEEAIAKLRKSQPHGFVDSVESAAGGIASKLLNVISRPNWAIAGAVDRGTSGGSWLKGFESGIEGKTHTTFGDVLQHHGVLTDHKWLQSGLGLGLDIATDPTTYLFGAGIYKDAGAFGLKAGLSEVEKKGAAALGEGAVAKAAQKLGTGKEVEKLVAKAAQGGKATSKELSTFRGESAIHNSLARAAEEEFKFGKNKYLQLRLGVTKKYSVGLDTPLRLSKSRQAILAGSGPLDKIRQSVGRAFSPGYDNPIAHAFEITSRHQMERIHTDLAKELDHTIGEHARHMSVEDMQKALFSGEVKGAVNPKTLKLRTKFIRSELAKRGVHGLAADKAMGFLHSWHDAMTRLADSEEALGVKYAGGRIRDRIYVPHVYDRAAPGKPATFSLLAHQGLEKARSTKDMSFEKQVELAGRSGFSGPLETNPVRLFAHRVAKSARASATANLRDALVHSYGVPEKVYNPNRYKRAYKVVNARKQQLSEAEKFLENAPRDLHSQRTSLGIRQADELKMHDQGMAKIQSELEGFQKEAKTSRVRGQGGKFSKRSPQQKAALSRKIKSRQTKLAKLAEDRKIIQARHVEEKNALVLSHEKNVQDITKKVDALKLAITKATPRARQRMYEKNPEAFREGLLHVAQLDKVRTFPDGTKVRVPVRIPADLEESINRVEKVLSSDTATKALEDLVGKLTSHWKMLVTTVNPGYRFRNTISDLWNMFISGVPIWAIGKYGIKATRLMLRAAGKTGTEAQQLEAKRILLMANDHGVMSGLFLGDVARHGDKIIGKQSLYRRATEASVRWNGAAENWGRLTHYLYRTDREGMSPVAAAQHVRMAHFDYEDLTPLERNHLKKYIPFYTWTRKNVPYQLQQIVSRPGRVATYTKTAQESENASGVKPGEIVGQALQGHPLAFKAGSGYIDPQIGLGDLFRVTDAKQLTSMVTPLITTPLQLATGRNFYTGQPITPDNHPLIPSNKYIADVASAFGLGGTTTRFVPGKGEVAGPGINPNLDFILGQLPWVNYLKSKGNPVRDTQNQDTNIGAFGSKDLSQFLGVSYTKVDPTAEKYYAQLDMADWLKKQIAAARDRGDLPPSEKKKLSAFENILAQISYANVGRG